MEKSPPLKVLKIGDPSTTLGMTKMRKYRLITFSVASFLGNEFFSNVYNNPIIAAINDLDRAEEAINSPCNIIFLLKGDIFNIKSIVDKAKEGNKLIYLHIDLMEGFSKDVVALRYINEELSPNGIITTRGNLVKAAKGMHIFTIQRYSF